MQRLLIADSSNIYAKRLIKELSDEFLIEICTDGSAVLEKLSMFQPDILVLDTMLRGIDSYTVLHTLRAAGHSTSVIVLSDLTDSLTVKRLNALAVNSIIPKPCAVNFVIANIKDLSFRLRYPNVHDWCVENEIDQILLSLSFRMGPGSNKVLWHAVMYRYQNPDCSYTKELCPAVAKLCGGNALQVEKAIRDAVGRAFEDGDKGIWQMYFPVGKAGQCYKPGADAFVSRIAHCLIQRTRIKKPYVLSKEKAE